MLSEMFGNTSALKLCVPCGFDNAVIVNSINHFLWKLLTTGKVNTLHVIIIKSIGKQQNMEIALNVAMHTTIRQINIAERLNVDGKYTPTQ